MADNVQILQAANAVLGEGPIWDSVERVFYWADLKRFNIYRYDLEKGQTGFWPLPYQFGCFALRQRGDMIVVTDHGYEFLDLATGELSPVVDPEAGGEFDHCYNDGSVDPGGRFWVGSLPMAGARGETITEATGRLYSLDADGKLVNHHGGLYNTNGMGWSPDGSRMYHIDSWIRTVFVHDYDVGSGAIGNRRALRVFAESDGYPDGLTVDADGHIWIAMWDGWKIVNLDDKGDTVREISVPVQRPTSCCFGGEDLNTLFITSASAYLTARDLARGPQAGAVLAVEPGVVGLPDRRYAG
ncbi:MAG: SMP-30/gluconolactonase/LRE family protein [Alphaproteobacteria bacterium]